MTAGAQPCESGWRRGGPAIRIDELYDKYAHLVHRRCLVLLGNPADAEDALQEVFVRAMRYQDSFRGESSPMTWLYRISTNHCLNAIRSAKRRRFRLQQRANEPTAPASNPPGSIEDAAVIRELLPRFDRSSQEIAVYYFVDGMSQDEVARQTGLSVPTVRKRLRKFVERARKHLSSGEG